MSNVSVYYGIFLIYYLSYKYVLPFRGAITVKNTSTTNVGNKRHFVVRFTLVITQQGKFKNVIRQEIYMRIYISAVLPVLK